MQKIEQYLLCECIEALSDVLEGMREATAKELFERADSGKKDSYYFDVLPENIFRRRLLEEYDKHIVLVTEEKGEFNYEEISEAEIVVFSDPTDRSSFLKEFLVRETEKAGDEDISFGSLLDAEATINTWESFAGKPDHLFHRLRIQVASTNCRGHGR